LYYALIGQIYRDNEDTYSGQEDSQVPYERFAIVSAPIKCVTSDRPFLRTNQ